jgi:hypothetical protein
MALAGGLLGSGLASAGFIDGAPCPAFFELEFGNIVCKKVRRSELSQQDANLIFEHLGRVTIKCLLTPPLFERRWIWLIICVRVCTIACTWRWHCTSRSNWSRPTDGSSELSETRHRHLICSGSRTFDEERGVLAYHGGVSSMGESMVVGAAGTPVGKG